jgi:hypothetical protein
VGGTERGGINKMRASLNPISRFDFGTLTALEHVRDWQAK